jgi:hypothetical protein
MPWGRRFQRKITASLQELPHVYVITRPLQPGIGRGRGGGSKKQSAPPVILESLNYFMYNAAEVIRRFSVNRGC